MKRRETKLYRQLAEAPASLFQFDPRMKEGWFSDRYFLRSADTLAHEGLDPHVTMQFFSKHAGVVAGLMESIRMFETQIANGYRPEQIMIETLLEGDEIAPWETVMLVHGPYRAFAHLETTSLGVLARRTLVGSNVRTVTQAANGKPVIFMAARHDDWRVQTPDGYAARIGGMKEVSSNAGGAWWGGEGVGTMPHALIAAMKGNIAAATVAFTRTMREREPQVRTISLVDFNNNCVRDAVLVADAMRAEFGEGALAGVRLDTSEKLIDEGLVRLGFGSRDLDDVSVSECRGVNPHLVRAVRRALDDAGHPGVKIIVSGGFHPNKIKLFESAGVPVDGYGVGSSLLGHTDTKNGLYNSFDFTADIVTSDGLPAAKVGRRLNPNHRLITLNWERARQATAVPAYA